MVPLLLGYFLRGLGNSQERGHSTGMRIKLGDPGTEDIFVFLDGVIVGCVVEADSKEGWVDRVLTNQIRAQIGMEPVCSTKEREPVRQHGVVQIMKNLSHTPDPKDAMAKMLEDLARKIRSGETEVVHAEQEYPAERKWSGDRWEFFRTGNLVLKLTYRDPKFQSAEIARFMAFPEG